MNDRYLFRGKRVDNGEWIIGDLSQWNDGDMYICKQHRQFDEEYEVIPETVGQCTGLKDKNGKLIFEGDILKSYYDDVFPQNAMLEQVVWKENAWFKKQRNNWDVLDETEKLPYSEVHGNVYDNPELLEVEICELQN